jgi:hypothetical protein
LRTHPVDFYYSNIFNYFHANPEVKLAFFGTERFFYKKKHYYKKDGKRGFSILKQKLLSSPVGMTVMYRNILFDIVDETVQWLISGGIVNWAKKVDFRSELRPFDPDRDEPKVLDFDDLSHGFAIWLISCGISFLGFVFELFRACFNSAGCVV